MTRVGILTFLATVFLLQHGAAFAEGVIEINQARAEAGSVSLGDSPGFPVELRESGSYRLTSDLVAPVGSDAIKIETVDVTLDLGGFRILGSGCTPSGDDYSCSATAGIGDGDGVISNELGSVLRNGSVQGFFQGVGLDSAARVRDLNVSANADDGIYVGHGSLVERLMIESNRYGLATRSGCVVLDSVARSNGDDGINGLSGSVFSGFQAEGNAGAGIEAGSGVIVRTSAAVKNAEAGIEARAGSLVISSATRSNASGLSLGSQSGFTNNVISESDPTTGGVYMTPNLCNGTQGAIACQ